MPETKRKRKGTKRDRWLKARRMQFRAALAYGEYSVAEFCERAGFSHSALNYVLRGERRSPWINECVRKLIWAELGKDIGEHPDEKTPPPARG